MRFLSPEGLVYWAPKESTLFVFLPSLLFLLSFGIAPQLHLWSKPQAIVVLFIDGLLTSVRSSKDFLGVISESVQPVFSTDES